MNRRERTTPSERRYALPNSCGEPAAPGAQIGALCDAIRRTQGEVGVRRILGVLSLAKKYGTAAVDDACAAALEMGVQEYRLVRRYLERCPQAPLSLHQVDPLIRELVQYEMLERVMAVVKTLAWGRAYAERPFAPRSGIRNPEPSEFGGLGYYG